MVKVWKTSPMAFLENRMTQIWWPKYGPFSNRCLNIGPFSNIRLKMNLFSNICLKIDHIWLILFSNSPLGQFFKLSPFNRGCKLPPLDGMEICLSYKIEASSMQLWSQNPKANKQPWAKVISRGRINKFWKNTPGDLFKTCMKMDRIFKHMFENGSIFKHLFLNGPYLAHPIFKLAIGPVFQTFTI